MLRTVAENDRFTQLEQVRVLDQWIDIHKMLPLADLGIAPSPVDHSIPLYSDAQKQLFARLEADWRWQREQCLERFCAQVESMSEPSDDSPPANANRHKNPTEIPESAV